MIISTRIKMTPTATATKYSSRSCKNKNQRKKILLRKFLPSNDIWTGLFVVGWPWRSFGSSYTSARRRMRFLSRWDRLRDRLLAGFLLLKRPPLSILLCYTRANSCLEIWQMKRPLFDHESFGCLRQERLDTTADEFEMRRTNGSFSIKRAHPRRMTISDNPTTS